MAVEFNAYRNNAVVPKLPRYKKPYTPQSNNMDPSAYYAEAFGFIPIDARYMVNTTNSLAYNSMADVLLNSAAWDKRWEDSEYSWMTEWWAYIPRVVVDTALLLKDTVVDPVAQGWKEDGWSGVGRGLSTAAINSLVNVGNTLDVLSNPIKGAVIEGFTPGGKSAGEGFMTGLVGDENGRKQYDYMDYTDEGEFLNFGDSGWANTGEIIASFALEIISDPLNWASLGGKQVIKSGANAVADTATKAVKTALDEALDTGLKTVDDLVPKLTSSVKYLDDATARTMLTSIADETGTVSKAAVNELTDSMQPLLKRALTRAEVAGGKPINYAKLAQDLAQSKSTKYKASFFDFGGAKMTPAAQAASASYLKNAATNLPDLLARNASGKVKFGAGVVKSVHTTEKLLRNVGGAAFVGLIKTYQAGRYVKGVIRNALAVRDPGVIRTLEQLTQITGLEDTAKVVEVLEKDITPKVNVKFITNIRELNAEYLNQILSNKMNRRSVQSLISLQKTNLDKLDGFVKELNITGVNTFDDYIRFLNNKNIAFKDSAIAAYITELETIKKVFTEDFTDKTVRANYRSSLRLLASETAHSTVYQADHMAELNKQYDAWYKKYGSKVTKALEEHGEAVDDAISVITKEDFLTNFERSILPNTREALIAAKKYGVHSDVVDSFQELWDDFKEKLNAFDADPDDLFVKSDLVESYKALNERLQSFLQFKNTDELTASSASEIYNSIGQRYLNDADAMITTVRLTDKDYNIINLYDELWEKYLQKDRVFKDLLTERNRVAQLLKNGTTQEDIAIIKEIIEDLDSKIKEHLLDNYSKRFKGVLNIYEQGPKLKQLVQSSGVGDNFTLKELQHAIEELPEFNIQRLDNLIDPADITKYKLVFYNIMNRRSSMLNLLLGLDTEGAALIRSVIELKGTTVVNKASYSDARVGEFLTFLKDSKRLPAMNRVVGKGQESVLRTAFVNELRGAAEYYLGRTKLDSVMGQWFYDYHWLDLDSYARTNSAFKEVWDYYNKLLDMKNTIEFEKDITHFTAELNQTVNKLKDLIDKAPTLHIKEKLTKESILLQQQAEQLLKMSDDEILGLAKIDIENVFDYPDAFLDKLLTLAEDSNSSLYRLLHSDAFMSNPSYSSTLKSVNEFIERIRSYKGLVTRISDFTKARGLEGFYTEALLDQVMTQLSKSNHITADTLDTVVDEIMTGVNTFLRNRFDTPSLAMDRVLWQTVNKFSNKRNPLAVQAQHLVDQIRGRLESGLAHGAVADVDNLVDLIRLSEWSDDPRIKGILSKLRSEAKGRNIVVFDIESTGANEAASQIFQISGKVLNSEGFEIAGSRFNYIIKPPQGFKPTPNVLRTLAPAGVDPTEWWNKNIVNAVSSDTQTVFDNIEDALNAFTDHCNKQGSVILAGHNIKAYDIPALIKRANPANTFFENVDTFDTLRFMNNKTVFQLTDEQELLFKEELKSIFKTAINNDDAILKNKPFSYGDVNTLSELKQLLKDTKTDGVSKYSIGEQTALDEAALYKMGIEDGALDKMSVGELEATSELEDIINGVLDSWRSPAKIKGASNYFVVSKLNPDEMLDTMNNYFKELADKGLINIKPGKNIMQYLTSEVALGHILINPMKTISYEVEDIFDLNKALEIYRVQNIEPGKTVKSFDLALNKKGTKLTPQATYYEHSNVLRIQDLAKLTKQARSIQRIRNWIPEDFVKAVVDDARAFLKEAETEFSFLKCLYADADNITIVAAAVYTYNKLSDDNALKQMVDFAKFGDVSKTIADLRGYKYTPLMREIDSKTGLPRFIFEDEFYSYDEIVNVIKHDAYLDAVREYNVGHNLYNLAEAAKHAMMEPVSNLFKDIETYLSGFGKNRQAVERIIKKYNDSLNAAAIDEILNRSNRVTALQAEMYTRGGYVVFETNNKIDLTDFKNSDAFVVVDNVLTKDGKFAQFICATRETFATAEDIAFDTKVIKGVEGMSDEVYNFILQTRKMASDNGVKNIGYSSGNAFTKETVETIHDALRRMGISEDVINKLPSVDDLTSSEFFKTIRADNSIIGGKSLWAFITDNPDARYITDPFKQMLYTTQSAIGIQRNKLMQYCNLLLNKHSDINAADLFKELSDEDLYKILKKNPDMRLVYMTQSGTLNKTASGLVVKEFDVVNVASIRRARKMGGVHIMPFEQASQLMKAVNEFELPFIVSIAKDISDIFKVAYLGSIGFLIRNIIDSNYKTYASLEGQVSLPKSVKHFFQSLGYVRDHTVIGQEYTKYMQRTFNSDFEYEIFYKFCKDYNNPNVSTRVVSDWIEEYKTRITKQFGADSDKLSKFNLDKWERKITRLVSDMSDKLPKETLNRVNKHLIQPELYSIIDSFINHGPSAGLAKSILNNIPNASKSFDELGVLKGFNKMMTEKTPLKYVYGANDYIEQAARLSMFLQRLELGDSIDVANRAIIKAHFDYSDKTIGMLYTEILFPFMSFSYKNLNFWVDTVSKNPMLVGQMENIFRSILDYNSLFEPDQEAYEAYDYTFDWSKDVTSFQSNAPWAYINAARLYHILNGNILVKSGEVMHDAGYGEQMNDLYNVFKLSPSVLDAVKMLYNPLNTYTERLLPPGETIKNIFSGLAEGKDVVGQMSVASLVNTLPYLDVISQRLGVDDITSNGFKWKHNNMGQRIQDAGPLQIVGSLFGTAYVPQKDKMDFYDSDYNILGGLKQNYYAKRNYSNPYNSKYPTYTLTRMAQNNKPKSIYSKSKTYDAYSHQYNYYVQNAADRILRYRIKDYYRYY